MLLAMGGTPRLSPRLSPRLQINLQAIDHTPKESSPLPSSPPVLSFPLSALEKEKKKRRRSEEDVSGENSFWKLQYHDQQKQNEKVKAKLWTSLSQNTFLREELRQVRRKYQLLQEEQARKEEVLQAQNQSLLTQVQTIQEQSGRLSYSLSVLNGQSELYLSTMTKLQQQNQALKKVIAQL